MSIFNWFSKKQPTKTATAEYRLSLGDVDVTGPQPNHLGADRNNARLERRQLLYGVVRDSMISAGVLAASYKFKVLSLDSAGRQYLVMMDIATKVASDVIRLAEIEALMVQAAKMRHGISVTAVYWRVNDHLVVGLPSNQESPLSQTPSKAPESKTGAQPVDNQKPRYEPLLKDEVAAFKRALTSASSSMPLSASGQIVKSGRRNPAPPEEFQDTQLVDPDDHASPLSGTQYGDLN